jgi:hypothetical protein
VHIGRVADLLGKLCFVTVLAKRRWIIVNEGLTNHDHHINKVIYNLERIRKIGRVVMQRPAKSWFRKGLKGSIPLSSAKIVEKSLWV